MMQTFPPFPSPREHSLQKVRVTVPIPCDVHEAFKRLAAASGSSVGRAMGDWLSGMVDAVHFTADKMEKAKHAPALAMREMHLYAQSLAEETGEIVRRMRDAGAANGGACAGAGASEARPPLRASR